jgi:histidine triad (HIT) family protein
VTACNFCRIAAGELAAHVIHEEPSRLAFLDHRPLFPGHVLVIPRAHVPTLADLPEADLGPLFALVRRIGGALESELGAEGTFVAVNNKVSQSVPHLHIHVVPRRKGDGLRGFFWPRRPYASDAEAAAVARLLSTALARR